MELRDKLFTEEQYLKQLAKYTNKISGLENEISQFVNNKVEFDASIYYGRLVDYSELCKALHNSFYVKS